jgi:tetratricopeptide (TPR) repeat protein
LLSFYLNYQVAGDSAFAFHLPNVLLHLACVLLVGSLVRRHFGPKAAMISATLFGIHPVNSQAVNYVWSRSVLLMSVFVLLALLAARRNRWLTLLLFQLAVWSRGEALVAVLPLIWLNPRNWRTLVGITSANLLVLLIFVVTRQPAEFAWYHSDIWQYYLAGPVAFWKYVQLIVFPFGFSIYHTVTHPSAAEFALSLFFLVVLLLLGAYVGRRYRAVKLGLAWLVLFLAPSILIPNADLVNESRIYLASAGVFLGLSTLLGGPRGTEGADGQNIGQGALADEISVGLNTLSRGRLLVLVGLGALLCLVTVQRNEIWANDVALWEEAARRSPGDDLVAYNLAVAYARTGRISEARSSFHRALGLNPKDDLSYAGLGFCAESEGQWLEAIDHYSMALTLNPSNGYARESMERVKAILKRQESVF